MLQSISGFFVRLAERWMPDPLVIAIALTMLCSAAAVAFTPFSVAETVDAWGEGIESTWVHRCPGHIKFSKFCSVVLGSARNARLC